MFVLGVEPLVLILYVPLAYKAALFDVGSLSG